MKKMWIVFLFSSVTQAMECQPPGQGLLEARLKDVFQTKLGETELREWMNHPKNAEVRRELTALDRRIKFTAFRTQREELLMESQQKFEAAIANNERGDEIENFPLKNSKSKLSGSGGALTIEITNLPKNELDILDKSILDKLEGKVKINYYYPYDKFEYVLTYNGEELPMQKALGKVQQDMEAACDQRIYDNGEYRRWYKGTHGGEANAASTGSSGSAGSASMRSGRGQ